MKKIYSYLLIFGFLTPIICNAYQSNNQNINDMPSDLEYYGSHMITTLAAELSMPIVVVLGGAIGIAGDFILKNEPSIMTSLGLLGGITSSLIILYKTPSWTDEYILNLKAKRTDGQKLIGFLSRLLLIGPIGPLVGEILVKNKLYIAEQNLNYCY